MNARNAALLEACRAICWGCSKGITLVGRRHRNDVYICLTDCPALPIRELMR